MKHKKELGYFILGSGLTVGGFLVGNAIINQINENNSNGTKPVFNTEERIELKNIPSDKILSLMDSTYLVIKNYGPGIDSSIRPIFHGDLDSFLKFANTLQRRYNNESVNLSGARHDSLMTRTVRAQDNLEKITNMRLGDVETGKVFDVLKYDFMDEELYLYRLTFGDIEPIGTILHGRTIHVDKYKKNDRGMIVQTDNYDKNIAIVDEGNIAELLR